MLFSGLILMGMIMETLGLSYVIPAAQCDLQLTLQQKGWLAAIPFVAIIVTSHFWGWVADTKGRRSMMLATMVVSVVLSTLSSFSPNLIVFSILRFLACVLFELMDDSVPSIAGPSGVTYAYLGEFNSSRHRDKMVAFGASFVGIGTVVLPAVSWLILPLEFSFPISFLGIEYRPWRLLVVACAVPYAVGALIMLWAAESPKFLIATGKNEECLAVVRRIYAVNQRTGEDEFPIKSIISEKQSLDESSGGGARAVLRSMWAQTAPLFRPPLLAWTCLACFVQFGIFATANGFYVWFPTILNSLAAHTSDGGDAARICDVLGGQHFNNDTSAACDDAVSAATFQRAIVVGLVFCSMYIVVGTIVDIVGKRVILVFVLGVAGVCGACAHLVEDQVVAVALFGIFQMSGACIGLLTAVVVELYPTKLRAMAVCLALMMGRVGSVLGSNVIGLLLETECALSFYLFGGLLIVCSLLCLTLPGKKPRSKKSKIDNSSETIQTEVPDVISIRL
ncbi:Synaptic vesicle glycoprotein 2A [Eumeta japonica]|uniref:Synaptic vesicle glycoprotein 2A n=1 Tax=Eumeta variegata TaxID=151549 RepID=A0A4C1U5C0_EUMVA|nr:Synaptic vesicle glycoprotein 2A [Eumeta japonica]